MQLKTLDVQAGNAVASGLPDLCLRLGLLSASSSAAANLCGLCIIRQPKLDIIMPSFSCFSSSSSFCGYFRLTDLLLSTAEANELSNWFRGQPFTIYDIQYDIHSVCVWFGNPHTTFANLFVISLLFLISSASKLNANFKIEQPKQRIQQQSREYNNSSKTKQKVTKETKQKTKLNKQVSKNF